MAFQLSPGVNVSEVDLTTVIPAVSTTVAATGGVFAWGPVDKAVLVTSEAELAAKFGKPSNINAETWFTAASFLAYSSALYVSRAHKSTDSGFYQSADTTTTVDDVNIVIVGDNATGVTVGDAVFGPGIEEGTTVATVGVSGSDTEIALSQNASATATGINVSFFDNNLSLNAVANSSTASLIACVVKNEDDYSEDDIPAGVEYVARYPGAVGNSLKVSVCHTASAFSSTLDLTTTGNTVNQNIAFTVGSNTATISIEASGDSTGTETAGAITDVTDDLTIGDQIKVGNSEIGVQYLTLTSIGTPEQNVNDSTAVLGFAQIFTQSADFTSTSIDRLWEHWDIVSGAPGQSDYQLQQGNTAASDEMHVVVTDQDGKVSGVPGQVLEVFDRVSRASDARNNDGGTNFHKEIINEQSQFIWHGNDVSGATSATSQQLVSATNLSPYTASFIGGRDVGNETSTSIGNVPSAPIGSVINAFLQYKSPEDIDVSLLLTGKSRGGSNGEQLANYLIDNIAETRRDCVVFSSPEKGDVVNNSAGDEEADVVQFRNACRSTSYAVLDSGYKYMYDKYNDVYRWIPLNGDTAGLAARTDDIRDPWFSPAGFNRGQIKNVIKLAWNPKKAERDLLYKNGVNPVVNFPGQGIVLFGDKTLLAKPSAFDRINVRRLFIVLEKAIATASKFTLFEFNDEFTRASFVNLVEPFLRNVQGRRGITDFVVVCDETNNTGEVIDRNEFVGDIYIKPARSINFIQLNFVAVRSGVEFSEVIGNF